MAIDEGLQRQNLTGNLPVLILSAGTLLGFLADLLFGTTGPIGIGYFLWTGLFAAALGWLARYSVDANPLVIASWSCTAIAAAGVILFRTTPVVILSMLLVMGVAMAMIILHLGGRSLKESTLSDHLRALLAVPVQGTTGATGILAAIDFRGSFRDPRVWACLRGALLALPLLLIFTALFSSADEVFGRWFSRLTEVLSENSLRHLALTLLFAWLASGLLASVSGNRFSPRDWQLPRLKLGTEDTAVLMGSLALLFLAFVLLQLGYLFGGRETIEATSGLTLAQYARRGFFELLVVAGLTLALLIAVANSGCNRRVFAPLAAVLLVCVLVIQVSAGQRLLLYIGEFGLTVDRLVALAVMLWLAIGIILFAGTLLRGQTRLFAAGMTIGGIVVVFGLAFANPASLIARVNIDRAADRHGILDTNYLLGLGTDAVPVMVENLDSLPLPGRCGPAVILYYRWYDNPAPAFSAAGDWRSWNFSRARATDLVADFESRLKDLTRTCLIGNTVINFLGHPQLAVTVDGQRIDAIRLLRWIQSSR